ncbi:MAG: alpha/beta hydrolase [Sphingobacteriales bacterium]|nr:MAG: alpha/beta hydrolase [Sphingobacteriales bacterium]
MKFISLLFLFVTCQHFLLGQSPARYRDQVFEEVNRRKNISYQDSATTPVRRNLMDLYEPAGDTLLSRPVIVLMHGGGFKFGSKNISRMKIWGRRFARKGYVVAAINYRLSKKKPLSKFPDLAEGCIEGMEDAATAVRYLRAHARELRINPASVILAGHSAGGMIAIQSVYSSAGEIRSLIKKGKEGVGTTRKPETSHNPQQIAAVVNFWGAIYDTTWLQNTRVPIVNIHGSKDRVVPANFNGNPLFGSIAIHRNAIRLGIPAALKIYQGIGHELQKHFNPIYAGPVARKRWRNAADFAASFLYDKVNL